MRLIVWGTYDTGKPRVRLLLRGLREAGAEITEIHSHVWAGVEDKGTLKGPVAHLGRALKLLAAYPRLIWRLARAPKPDAILVSYPGHVDVFVLWPIAKLRGIPVVWDVFLSAYNTIVEDRAKLRAGSLGARVVAALERRAVRSVDRAFMDTRAHADYLASLSKLPLDAVGHVPVGVEPEAFPHAATPENAHSDEINVLFYGQFIPLHGIDTIIKAARLDVQSRVRWTLIGTGQMEDDIRALLDEEPLERLTWTPWVPYGELVQHIQAADVCLGVFGTSAKARRVIPNKVFQILSAGKPLVTQTSADLAELAGQDPAIGYVPPGHPQALLERVIEMGTWARQAEGPHHSQTWDQISPLAVGQAALAELEKVTKPSKL